MTERSSEQIKQPHYVSTGKSVDDLLAELEQRERSRLEQQTRASCSSRPTNNHGDKKPQLAYPDPRVTRNRYQTSTTSPELSKSSGPNILGKKNARRHAIVRLSGIALATGVVIGGGVIVYETNTLNSRTVVRDVMGWPNVTNGPDSLPPVKLSTGSLSLDQCNDPDKAIITMVASADVPLIPQYDGANVPAYLTKANEKTVAPGNQEEYKKFITNDGFPHFVVEELPFDVAACGTNAISGEDSGHATVDRTKVQIKFKDPSAAFNAPVVVQPEFVNSSHSKDLEPTKLNPNKGGYMKYPIAKYNPGTNGKDPEFDKAMNDLFTNMQNEDQINAMTALAEEKIVQQVNSDDGQQLPIEYPDGSTHSLRDVIDNVLTYRYGKHLTFDGVNYDVRINTKIDPATKLSVSSNLKGFDQTQPAEIKSIKIEYGAEKPPADTSTSTEASSTK